MSCAHAAGTIESWKNVEEKKTAEKRKCRCEYAIRGVAWLSANKSVAKKRVRTRGGTCCYSAEMWRWSLRWLIQTTRHMETFAERANEEKKDTTIETYALAWKEVIGRRKRESIEQFALISSPLTRLGTFNIELFVQFSRDYIILNTCRSKVLTNEKRRILFAGFWWKKPLGEQRNRTSYVILIFLRSISHSNKNCFHNQRVFFHSSNRILFA